MQNFRARREKISKTHVELIKQINIYIYIYIYTYIYIYIFIFFV